MREFLILDYLYIFLAGPNEIKDLHLCTPTATSSDTVTAAPVCLISPCCIVVKSVSSHRIGHLFLGYVALCFSEAFPPSLAANLTVG